jgi:hypothetical protein
MKFKMRLIPSVILIVAILFCLPAFAHTKCCRYPNRTTVKTQKLIGQCYDYVKVGENIKACSVCKRGYCDIYENKVYRIYQVFETTTCSICYDRDEISYDVTRYYKSAGYTLRCDYCGVAG